MSSKLLWCLPALASLACAVLDLAAYHIILLGPVRLLDSFVRWKDVAKKNLQAGRLMSFWCCARVHIIQA